MELRQLRYFCAIAARSSFRQASDDVHVAQPALSQQIRKLEDELGVALFDRDSRPIALTDAGLALLPRAQRILADVEGASAHVREYATEFRGRLVIAMMQYLTWLELPDLITEFTHRHPAVEVALATGNTGEVLDRINAGTADLGFCHIDAVGAGSGLELEGLRSEELVVIMRPSDPLAAYESVTVAQLAEAPFILFRPGASIRDALEQRFAELGLSVRMSLETGDMMAAIALVSRGFGVSLVPRSVADAYSAGRVASRPIGPVPLHRRIGMVWRTETHRTRAMEAFQASARRFVARRG